MRRSRRSRGENDYLKIMAGIFLFCISVAAFAIALYFWISSDPIVARLPDGCPSTGPASITVILIDTSDELPDPSKQELTKYILDIGNTLPIGSYVELRLLDPKVKGGKVEFAGCNPGDGSNLNEITGNPRLAQKRWKEKFQDPLIQSIEVALRPIPAQISPIFATLQAIAIDRFTGMKNERLPKSLVIISDLIEHTPEYSQYHGDLTYDRFKKSTLYKKVKTDLHGAVVRIFYVQRKTSSPIDSGAHIRFWFDWVKDNNGVFLDAKKLQGMR